MSLRRPLRAVMIVLAAVTLIASGALIVFTTLLRIKIDELVAAARVDTLAGELENYAMAHTFETTPSGRVLSEARGRRLLARADEVARTPADRQQFDRLRPYLEQVWRPSNVPGELPADLVVSVERTREGFARELRSKQAAAQRLDTIANEVGIASAVLLATCVLFSVWWVRRMVYRPIASLETAIRKFDNGDREARAGEDGAVEIQRIARMYNAMADALGRARQDQLRYVATVVDDLRNPLAAVQLAAGYVSDERPLPPERRIRELFALIDRQLQRANSIVGDVLNSVQIDEGTIVLKLDRFDLAAAARESVAQFQNLAPTHRFEVECTGSTMIVADQRRIEQVLNNLLSNAAKYSPPASAVKLTIEGIADSVSILVSNDGPGITAELRDRVFQPFVRGRSEFEQSPGVGLGLYVSRRIVVAHGGTMELLSSSEAGTTFRMRLPRRTVPNVPSGDLSAIA